ncbi:histone deacetylase family protein [Selenihalanaerobacter shriftii]|uniref:Acetoin utilization deacetylase AcuC n=1 Tax=Selenihalanaerobacter shriftii TaxID=142842 RepID=A0A1T4Q0G1_9FIRM|nr:histone deacetylase [Selenihalanaerobacter shriftii]SJZ97300.1 Acetoin utilization deacetylase AcuC [Selenihalanaerobacter shriftii]
MQIKAKNSLGLIFFPAFDWSISPTHPEREERLLYTKDQVLEEGLLDIEGIKEYNPLVANIEDINRTHICVPDTESIVSKPHLISAGGAIKAGELVMENKVDSAFAIIRPPGHHAFRIVHGARGFCTINNEAIMVEYLRQKYGNDLKIAFVDTDAHHADGTQNVFYNDPQILHISIHQDGRSLFPGTGFMNELGGPGAFAKTINLPLPPNTTDQGLHYALDNLILPILDDFKPDLIINAAGQDNHYSDPLTRMKITAQGYAKLNEKLNPDIAILQGGYSIESALPYVNVGIILAMAGLDYSYIQEPDYNQNIINQDEQITDTIKKRVEKLLTVWKNRNKVDITEQFGNTPYYTTRQNIYYDTDQIQEEQQIKIKLCPDCSGLIIIDSNARPSHFGKIRAIILPYDVCNKCKAVGYNKYESTKRTTEFSNVYLQDKVKDKLMTTF